MPRRRRNLRSAPAAADCLQGWFDFLIQIKWIVAASDRLLQLRVSVSCCESLSCGDCFISPCTPCTAPVTEPVTANAQGNNNGTQTFHQTIRAIHAATRPQRTIAESDGSEPEILAGINLDAILL